MVALTTLNINLIPSSLPVRLYCNQGDIGLGGDSGRYYYLNLQKDGVNYIPQQGAVITVEGTKPDGSTFTHTLTNIAMAVYMPLFADMTDIAGEVKLQIVVKEGNNRTASQMIILFVQRSAYDGNNTGI